ncbi:MAG TPA: cytochrome c peroxidase [Vicinamibacterales bacterium]|nr:cytochrome c peroxidase [Vicinamibacterales bacterium]
MPALGRVRLCLLSASIASLLAGGVAADLTPRERLGKLLFFDESLSAKGNQSCAACHDPKAGWVGGNERINKGGSVYEASIAGRFGDRKPPSAAYATVAPNFRLIDASGEFLGGNFWDGRATGEKLGNAAADQAIGPFLNPLEQALPDAGALVSKVCTGSYAALFKEVWGASACAEPEKAYGFIGLSIAAYEGSSEVNQFSAKYDAVLAGSAALTDEEALGLQLFIGKGRCAECHPTRGEGGTPAVFTDFRFHNIGVPRNPANPFYQNAAANPKGAAWIDGGLGEFLQTEPAHARHAQKNMGKHRVPTLRNVDLRPAPDFVKAYGHNGYFKSLQEIVHFYNTRDVLPACGGATQRAGVDCWPRPEVEANLNRKQLGKLGLSDAEERAIVAFLSTLSDGYVRRGAD